MADCNDKMGIDAFSPDDKTPQCQESEEELEQDQDMEESITVEEYDILDAKLDDLNTVLDVIEQKNDQIREEFLKLLHSNKKIREELQQENKQNETNHGKEGNLN